MRNLWPIIILILASNLSFGQAWIDEYQKNNPERSQKKNQVNYLENPDNLSFSEKQKAFNSYCNQRGITDGYYKIDGEKAKMPGFKQFRRYEFKWEARVDPKTGKYPDINQYLIREKRPSTRSNVIWESVGTKTTVGGYNGLGRVNCIAFNPSDENILYLGTPSGGFWKSTDAGNNWITTTDNMTSIGVSSILVSEDFATDNTIYIATGDKDAGDTPSCGILKSTSGGEDWSTTGLSFATSQGVRAYKLLAYPGTPSKIYASTSEGLYISDGNDAVWTKKTSSRFVDMEFNPNNPQIMYGSTPEGDIYKSINAGESWVKKMDISGGYRTEIAVSADDSDVIYAVVANSSSGLKGIYKSTDSGETFSQIINGSANGNYFLNHSTDGTGINNGQAWYDLTIAADPLNANRVYIGGINTWGSTDGGQNWELLNHWYGGGGAEAVHADKHEMIFRPGTSTLFEGNDGGIYKSTNNGNSWTDLSNTLVIGQIYRLGVCQNEKEQCVTGLQDNGTFLRSGTKQWYTVMGGDGMECAVDYTDPNTQYGESQYGNIKRTKNKWNNSTLIKPYENLEGAWITPFTLNPVNPKTLWIGYNKLYRSFDQGNSYQTVYNGNSSKLEHIAMSPADTNTIYIGYRSKILKSTDNGQNWEDLTSNIPLSLSYYRQIEYITVKNDDANTIWISLSQFDAHGVYESTDGGATWKNISAGLPEIPVNCVLEYHRNPNQQQLYAATDFGIYYRDGEQNWVEFNNGLPNVLVYELDMHYGDNKDNDWIFAATYGRGLWKSKPNGHVETHLLADVAELQFGYEEESKTFNISANMDWIINPAEDWISTQPAEGSNDALVTVTCQANNITEARESYISIEANDGTIVLVNIKQESHPVELEIDPENQEVNYQAGATEIEVTSNTNFEATIDDGADWLSLVNYTGINSGVITVSYQENTGENDREATISIQAKDVIKTFKLSQAVKTTEITINPEKINFEAKDGKKEADLSTNDTWTATSNQDWLTVSPASGNGNQKISIEVQENKIHKIRETSIVFATSDNKKAILNVTQKEAAFEVKLVPEQIKVDYKAGNTEFSIEHNAANAPSIENSCSWITLNQEASDSKTKVNIDYQENTLTTNRQCLIPVKFIFPNGEEIHNFTLTQKTKPTMLSEIKGNSVQIIPNPANDNVNIQTQNDVQRIFIWNSIGTLIWSKENPDSKEHISTSNWTPGIYIVSILSNHHLQKKILIIE
ncbi:MAG: BACON domain-containing protein [Bacteroidales bacterium]